MGRRGVVCRSGERSKVQKGKIDGIREERERCESENER